MSNTKATGFESSLIESWTKWNPIDTMCVAFDGAKLKHEIEGVDIDKTYFVRFDLDKFRVSIYNRHNDNVVKTLNMKITFE